MREVKLRHELKHEINYCDYLVLHQRLRAVAKSDPNVGPDGCYRIRSLYFDNIQDKALREKIDGVNNREKFRIRIYNDDHNFIKLEKKSKFNGLCGKQSAPITKEQCQSLISGDYYWMRESKEALVLELYTKMNYQLLRPKTVIDYLREPYIYEPGNVRLTIDYQIQTGLSCTDFLEPSIPKIFAGNQGTILLEVKYDEFLPDIISDIVQLNNRKASSFSKYAAGRIYG